jgi:hypothetical protein
MKITLDSVRQAFGSVKQGIQGGYHHAYKFAQELDHGVNVAKRLYSVVAPLLDSLGVSQKGSMRALGGYEELRRRAINANTRVEKTVADVRSRVPELSF